MKYLNAETQFTRVSDEHARMLMESAGYDVPSTNEQEEDVAHEVYENDGEMFALTEEIVEGEDDLLYVRLGEIDENTLVQVDESGRQVTVEAVEFEDETYILEGVYEDDEGNAFACMIPESAIDEAYESYDEDADEYEEEEYYDEDEDEEIREALASIDGAEEDEDIMDALYSLEEARRVPPKVGSQRGKTGMTSHGGVQIAGRAGKPGTGQGGTPRMDVKGTPVRPARGAAAKKGGQGLGQPERRTKGNPSIASSVRANIRNSRAARQASNIK